MTEENIIRMTPEPRTRESLVRELLYFGVKAGMTLIVHSSLRTVGWVSGGPVAVVQALMDVLTEEGTLVMPTQTGNYSDPAEWQDPPVPDEWKPIIYATMPAFHPLYTPSYKMGQVVETFRTWPGTVRSNHPIVSFAAWGKHADSIIDNHSLEYGLGEASPLAKMYGLAGSVLLLGVGYDRNTSFHLAEYRAPGAEEVWLGSPIYEDGVRVWKRYRDIDIDSDVFTEIGRELEAKGQIQIGRVGSAEARLFLQRPTIDFAVAWLTERRSQEI